MATALLDRIAAILTDEERGQILRGLPAPTLPTPITPTLPTLISGPRLLASGAMHEYSTFYPGDGKHRAVILSHDKGYCSIHYAGDDPKLGGQVYADLPPQINTGAQPRWRRKDPDRFLFLWLNEIREFYAGDLSIRTVRKFKQFPSINGMGESDISFDDDHLVLCSGRHVFVYEISTDRILVEYDAPAAFDSLYIGADNRALIGFYPPTPDAPAGTVDLGIQRLEYDGTLHQVAPALGHMDVGTYNGNPVLVWINAADATGPNRGASTPNCPNGVELRYLSGAEKPRCLLALHWSLAVHISCPDNKPWALVSTYDPKNPDSQEQYANAILQVGFNGNVRVLAEHHSNSSTYEGTPRAAVSPDGTRYVFDQKPDVWFGAIDPV